MMKLLLWFALSAFVLISTVVSCWSQCAMCRASIENNISENGQSLAAGLNTGILYLFVAPYLMVALIGFLWYWKAKGKNDRSLKTKGNPQR